MASKTLHQRKGVLEGNVERTTGNQSEEAKQRARLKWKEVTHKIALARKPDSIFEKIGSSWLASPSDDFGESISFFQELFCASTLNFNVI